MNMKSLHNAAGVGAPPAVCCSIAARSKGRLLLLTHGLRNTLQFSLQCEDIVYVLGGKLVQPITSTQE